MLIYAQSLQYLVTAVYNLLNYAVLFSMFVMNWSGKNNCNSASYLWWFLLWSFL